MCHADPAGRLGPCLSPLAPRSRTCGSSLGPRRESVPAAQNGTRDASSRGRWGGKQRGESCSRESARSNHVFPGVSGVLPSLLFIGFPMAGLHCRSGRSVFFSVDFPHLRASVFRGFPFVFCGAGSPWGELPPRYSKHPGKPLETPTGEVLPRMIRRHSTTRASGTEAPGGAGEPMTTGPGRGRCPHGGVSSFRSADARRWRSGPRPPPGDGRERPPRHRKAAGPRPLVRCRRSPAPV